MSSWLLYTLETLKRGLDLLAVLEQSDRDAGLTDPAERLGESRTVVFRMLRTFAGVRNHVVILRGDGDAHAPCTRLYRRA